MLKSIRENEPRATSLGYRTDDYKLLAFILSATLAGVAGATKSIVFGIATLTDVHWSMSGEVVLMTLVGGLGTVFGPVVGAAVIVTMQNYLAEIGAWVTVIQGVIFVVCVLAFRRGIIGELGGAAEGEAVTQEHPGRALPSLDPPTKGRRAFGNLGFQPSQLSNRSMTCSGCSCCTQWPAPSTRWQPSMLRAGAVAACARAPGRLVDAPVAACRR